MNGYTVIVPFRNGHATIEKLLASLPDGLPVLIVDDMSDKTYAPTRANVKCVRMKQRGYFAGAVNYGIDVTRGDVLVMNQDVWLDGNWQAQIAEWQSKGYAIAGDGVFGHPAHKAGYVQGTMMYLSRNAIDKVGAFNAVDFPLWGCTAEWQLRACRLGFAAYPCKPVGLNHTRHGDFGSSIKTALAQEPDKQDLFVRTPPLVSVVITCHNKGKYIPDAVHSLIGGKTDLGDFKPQTLQAFEIVIVDDASTDWSAQICEAFADPFKGINVIALDKNVGSAEAMNIGIRASRGRYIAPLDGDDMMETNRLDVLYRASLAHPHSVICDDAMLFKHGQRTQELRMPEYDFEKLIYKNGMHKGIFFPRKGWEECGGYPASVQNGREDWAINIALGAFGYCGVNVHSPMYLYRREQQNRSLTNYDVDWRRFFAEQMKSLFPSIYKGERSSMCCGSSSKKKVTPLSVNKVKGLGRGAVELVGASGMVAVEYMGAATGTMQFTGAVTGHSYSFGATRRIGYIDAQDLDGFLAMYHNQRQLFRETVVAKSEPVAQVVQVKEQPAQVVEPEPEQPKAYGIVPQSIAYESKNAVFTKTSFDAVAPEPDEKPKRRTRKKKSDDD